MLPEQELLDYAKLTSKLRAEIRKRAEELREKKEEEKFDSEDEAKD